LQILAQFQSRTLKVRREAYQQNRNCSCKVKFESTTAVPHLLQGQALDKKPLTEMFFGNIRHTVALNRFFLHEGRGKDCKKWIN